jgi:hypothetical protein
MYISNDKPINFPKFDDLCSILDEMLAHIPEMKSRRSRAQMSAHGRDILGKIWNLGHGTDLDDLCDGKSPSPLDGGC